MDMILQPGNTSAILDDESTEEEDMDDEEEVRMLQPAFGSGIPSLAPPPFIQRSSQEDTESTDEEEADTTLDNDSFKATNVNTAEGEADDVDTSMNINSIDFLANTKDPFRETTFDKQKRKMTTKKE